MWDHLHNLHVFDHSFLTYFTGGGDTICICPFSKMFKEYWGDMILYENETYASSHHDCCDKVYNDPTHLYKHFAVCARRAVCAQSAYTLKYKLIGVVSRIPLKEQSLIPYEDSFKLLSYSPLIAYQ